MDKIDKMNVMIENIYSFLNNLKIDGLVNSVQYMRDINSNLNTL